jgi:hypothetical protein
VHFGGLVVFRLMMQELLNIEQFCAREFFTKSKYFKYFNKIEALNSWYCWKTLDE